MWIRKKNNIEKVDNKKDKIWAIGISSTRRGVWQWWQIGPLIGPDCHQMGQISDFFSSHFTTFVQKSDLNSHGFVPFGANLSHLGPKSDIPGLRWPSLALEQSVDDGAWVEVTQVIVGLSCPHKHDGLTSGVGHGDSRTHLGTSKVKHSLSQWCLGNWFLNN